MINLSRRKNYETVSVSRRCNQPFARARINCHTTVNTTTIRKLRTVNKLELNIRFLDQSLVHVRQFQCEAYQGDREYRHNADGQEIGNVDIEHDNSFQIQFKDVSVSGLSGAVSSAGAVSPFPEILSSAILSIKTGSSAPAR